MRMTNSSSSPEPMRFRSTGRSSESLHQTEIKHIITSINWGDGPYFVVRPGPKEVKQCRIIICVKAMDATSLLGPWWTLRRVLFGDWPGFLGWIHFCLFGQSWKSISHSLTAFHVQYVIAITFASVQGRDDNWFRLASGQLNALKSLLRNSFAHDDSILLANAIFIIWRTIQTFSASEERHQSDIIHASSKALEILCSSSTSLYHTSSDSSLGTTGYTCFKSDDSSGCSSCCMRNRRYCYRRGHPFPDRRHGSRGTPSLSSLPTSRCATGHG